MSLLPSASLSPSLDPNPPAYSTPTLNQIHLPAQFYPLNPSLLPVPYVPSISTPKLRHSIHLSHHFPLIHFYTASFSLYPPAPVQGPLGGLNVFPVTSPPHSNIGRINHSVYHLNPILSLIGLHRYPPFLPRFYLHYHSPPPSLPMRLYPSLHLSLAPFSIVLPVTSLSHRHSPQFGSCRFPFLWRQNFAFKFVDAKVRQSRER